MAGFAEGLAGGLRRAFCTVANDVFYGWEALFGNDNNPYTGLNPFRSGYSLACDRPPPTSPPGNPPFTGGQCDAPYTVVYRQFLTDGDGSPVYIDSTATYPALLSGPIVGIRRTGSPNNSPNPQDRALFHLVYDGGANEVLLFDASVQNANADCTIVSVTRADGQPDNCGSLPPPLPIVPPPPREEPVTFDDPDGNPITVPVTFAFGLVYLDADLNVHIPVDIDVDFDIPINLRADFNLHTGDVIYNTGAPASPSPNRPDQPDGYETPPPPPPPVDLPPNYNPPDEEDTPETESILRGVIVKITQLPQNTNVWFNDGMPDLYYPRLGNVSFFVRTGNAFSWTEFVSITSTQQIIQCPWEGGALDVKASFYDGVAGELFPVYRRGEKGYTFSLSPSST